MIKQYKIENFESYENRLNYIQSEWETIREECLSIDIEYFNVYHTMIDVIDNDFGWYIYPLYYKSRLLDINRLAPKTVKILSTMDVVNASFSLFLPKTNTSLHSGNTPYTYRSHLGLKVPEDCGFEIENLDLSIKTSEINIFPSELPHVGWNDSEENRYTLMMDYLKPNTDINLIYKGKFGKNIKKYDKHTRTEINN